MPFINIDINNARKILEDKEELETVFKEGKINPKEYDVLKLLRSFANASEENKEESKVQLEQICQKYFEKESKRAFDLLLKFAEKRQNVSWVLFSRSNQYIHYSEKNPLEGYIPRKNEILKTVSRLTLNSN